MPEVQQVLPLVCTHEIASAIFNELTLGGRVAGDKVLVIGGANWQKNRIIQHLDEKLTQVKSLLSKMDKASKAAAAASALNSKAEIPDMGVLGGTKAYIRGRYGAQKELLEQLVKDLA